MTEERVLPLFIDAAHGFYDLGIRINNGDIGADIYAGIFLKDIYNYYNLIDIFNHITDKKLRFVWMYIKISDFIIPINIEKRSGYDILRITLYNLIEAGYNSQIYKAKDSYKSITLYLDNDGKCSVDEDDISYATEIIDRERHYSSVYDYFNDYFPNTETYVGTIEKLREMLSSVEAYKTLASAKDVIRSVINIAKSSYSSS